MSSLSIRNMNFTLQTMEHIRAKQAADWYANLPAAEKADRTRYWHVQRKARRGNRWITHKEFWETKREMAAIWRKYYQGKGFRLRFMLSY